MDKSGSIVSDTIKARGISEVETEIENRKLVPVKISEKKDFFSLFSNNKKILNLNQTSDFISNFSMMIETGLTIKSSIEALQESLKDKIILNKTPLRLSIIGGGTELPDYFKKYGGAVINSTINLFIISRVQKYKKNYLRIFLGDAGKEKIFRLNRLHTNDRKFKIHIAVYDYINKSFN